eukprot:scaffold63127_cov54-Phaeocystis_antarctica.AAC.2
MCAWRACSSVPFCTCMRSARIARLAEMLSVERSSHVSTTECRSVANERFRFSPIERSIATRRRSAASCSCGDDSASRVQRKRKAASSSSTTRIVSAITSTRCWPSISCSLADESSSVLEKVPGAGATSPALITSCGFDHIRSMDFRSMVGTSLALLPSRLQLCCATAGLAVSSKGEDSADGDRFFRVPWCPGYQRHAGKRAGASYFFLHLACVAVRYRRRGEGGSGRLKPLLNLRAAATRRASTCPFKRPPLPLVGVQLRSSLTGARATRAAWKSFQARLRRA